MIELTSSELEAEIQKLVMHINIEKVKARVCMKAINKKLRGADTIMITFFSSFFMTLLMPAIGKINYQKYMNKYQFLIGHPLYKIVKSNFVRNALL